MSVFWAILAALGLGIIANNLYDVMPWLAHRILRRAAVLEAETPDEAPLIYAESVAVLDEVPGKLTKLLFAIGRLSHALRHLRWRPRRKRISAWAGEWLGVISAMCGAVGALAVTAGVVIASFAGEGEWFVVLTQSSAATVSLSVVGLVVQIRRDKRRSR